MALRADQMVSDALKEERKTSFPRQSLNPDSMNQKDDFRISAQESSDHKQENGSNISKFPEVSAEKENLKEQAKAQLDVKEVKEDIREVRQEPEGQLADSTLMEEPRKPVVGCVVTSHVNFVSKLAVKHCS